MERYKKFLQKLHEYVQQDWDRLIPVVGDEGVGKSTLILESIWLYEEIRGNEPTPETVLDYVVFDDRDSFRDKLLAAEPGDPIAVMDAAHVLYNKDVMMPDQKEVEKSLLDIRTENYVIFLGYQDWGDIPRQLRKRRAKNVVRVPSRGTLKGYNRAQLNEKYDSFDDREWPDHALIDTFPSLEGTRLWERFNDIDRERKKRRLQREGDSETEVTPQDIVSKIVDRGELADYVEINEFQNRAYYSKPLLRYDFPELSDQQTDQVRAALRREADPEDLASEETDTNPPMTEGKT